MQELERARYEVAAYEAHLATLASIHHECSTPVNWPALVARQEPPGLMRASQHEDAARRRLEQYRVPRVIAWLGGEERAREELRAAVQSATQFDEALYQAALKEYHTQHTAWERVTGLGRRVKAGDPQAYIEAARHFNPFLGAEDMGRDVQLRAVDENLIEAIVHVYDEDIVPRQTRSLLKSGRLSVRDMSKTNFYAYYQDYVCGCVLRVARELFALLPVQLVIVTARGKLLDTTTGRTSLQPLVSVAFGRSDFSRLDFEQLDPSDAVGAFVHHMTFRKTSGFRPVTRLTPEDFGRRSPSAHTPS